MRDEDEDELTPRWWLDRADPEMAARLLGAADSVTTTAEEHEALAAELRPRGLVCVYEDGQTWVWTPVDLAELEAETDVRGTRGELEGERLPAKRGEPAVRVPVRVRRAR